MWETDRGVPLLLFALPDERTRTNRYAIEVPLGASLILTHDRHGIVRGLNEFPGQEPPVAALFWTFRLMVGIGLLMLALAWWAGWQLRRRPAPSAGVLRLLDARFLDHRFSP